MVPQLTEEQYGSPASPPSTNSRCSVDTCPRVWDKAS